MMRVHIGDEEEAYDEGEGNNNIMKKNEELSKKKQKKNEYDVEEEEEEEEEDNHEKDMVMPGFRFHPTEEELIEFYLRRKVEGKRFNVDLITFLDLYRYDPWLLPGT